MESPVANVPLGARQDGLKVGSFGRVHIIEIEGERLTSVDRATTDALAQLRPAEQEQQALVHDAKLKAEAQPPALAKLATLSKRL